MCRVIGFLAYLFVVFGVNANSLNLACQQHHCLAVVDAGSTGSRLHIYAYDFDDKHNPIKIDDVYSKKIDPGFASIELNQEAIDAYLTTLFAQAPEQNIPTYFYATGGLRLLSPQKQQLYFQILQQWFAAHTEWKLIESRIIDGSEEGLFGWLAVNYRSGALTSDNKPLVGVMDMGGASVQITFPVDYIDTINPHDLVQMDIYGRHLSLFVHSFLGLGMTEVLQKFQDLNECFPNGYPLPNGTSGHGDALACQRVIAQWINTEHSVSQLTKRTVANSLTNSWYVLGSVSAMAKTKPMLFEGSQYTSQDLLQQADTKICQQQWHDLKISYPENNYLYASCLTAAYAYGLTVNGYGLGSKQAINFMQNGVDFDWTLGVVLHQP